MLLPPKLLQVRNSAISVAQCGKDAKTQESIGWHGMQVRTSALHCLERFLQLAKQEQRLRPEPYGAPKNISNPVCLPS
jgi:hypothetical protein